jgi:hypothetical protein
MTINLNRILKSQLILIGIFVSLSFVTGCGTFDPENTAGRPIAQTLAFSQSDASTGTPAGENAGIDIIGAETFHVLRENSDWFAKWCPDNSGNQ